MSKNLRYFDAFRIFEMAQVVEQGEYHESTEDETLPIHKKYLTGCIVGKNAKEIFYEMKGVVEAMAEFCQMEELGFTEEELRPICPVTGSSDLEELGQMTENELSHPGQISMHI